MRSSGDQVLDHLRIGQQLSEQLAALMLVGFAQGNVVQFVEGPGGQQGFHGGLAGEQGAEQILPRLDVALRIDQPKQTGDPLLSHPMPDHGGAWVSRRPSIRPRRGA
jgi:hypothetical protein